MAQPGQRRFARPALIAAVLCCAVTGVGALGVARASRPASGRDLSAILAAFTREHGGLRGCAGCTSPQVLSIIQSTVDARYALVCYVETRRGRRHQGSEFFHRGRGWRGLRRGSRPPRRVRTDLGRCPKVRTR